MHQTSTLVSLDYKSSKDKQRIIPVEEPELPDYLVQNILNYSKSLSVEKSVLVGFIEVVSS
ncbi:MAG: hypothetical protein K0R26_2657 [Bacteroidota bacterium]|jgi:hypothetical protein|nr:hypothetical protein [Bacteroidota bacterium]